jgi:hypothetical protein
LVDSEVAGITLAGAYQKATASIEDGGLNMTHEQAIDYADKAMEESQGSGLEENQSLMLRDKNSYKRLFTMFQSFFNALYNRLAKRTGQVQKGVITPGEYIQSLALLWFIPSIVGEVLSGRGPKDEEDFWTWVAKTELLYPTRLFGVFSSIPAAMLSATTGQIQSNRTPIDEVGYRLGRTIKDVTKIPENDAGDNFKNLVKDGLYLSGLAVGIPSAQTDITLSAIMRAADGEEIEPRDLIFRPNK